jgi:hypothetical protein
MKNGASAKRREVGLLSQFSCQNWIRQLEFTVEADVLVGLEHGAGTGQGVTGEGAPRGERTGCQIFLSQLIKPLMPTWRHDLINADYLPKAPPPRTVDYVLGGADPGPQQTECGLLPI